MMNELILGLEVIAVISFMLGALRIGKEALVAAIGLLVILANLFILKQMTLFGLEVTGGNGFIIGMVIGVKLLQEFYGATVARRAIFTSFFLAVFTVIFSQVHLLFQPNAFDTMQPHFWAIFCGVPRILGASLATFVTVQLFDTALFSFFLKFFRGRYLPLRVTGTLLASQSLDTVLFCFLGLYGSVSSIIPIIKIGFMMKLVVIALATPVVALAKQCSSLTFQKRQKRHVHRKGFTKVSGGSPSPTMQK